MRSITISLLLCAALLCALAMPAQRVLPVLHPIEVDGKSGLLTDSGVVVLAPIMDEISQQCAGQYVVRQDGKLGFYTERQGLVVAPAWKSHRLLCYSRSYLLEGTQGVLLVNVDGEGNTTLCQGDSLRMSREGLGGILYQQSKKAVVDPMGKLLLGPECDDAGYSQAACWCRKGKTVEVAMLDVQQHLTFEGDSARRITTLELAVYANGKCGLADTNGRMIMRPQWDDLKRGANGGLVVTKGGRKGYLNADRRLTLPAVHEEVAQLGNGWLAVTHTGGKVYAYREDGRRLFALQGQGMASLDSRHLQVTREDGRVAALDSTGRCVVPYRFRYLASISGKLFGNAEGKGWFMLDAKGQPIGVVAVDVVKAFEGGLARVEKNGLHGLMNLQGELVLRPEWADLQRRGTVVRARKGNEWETFYFTEEGLVSDVPKILLDRDRWVDEKRRTAATGTGNWSGDWFMDDDGLWGLRDSTGSVAIQPRFRSHSPLVGDVSWVSVERHDGTRLMGFVDHRRARLIREPNLVIVRTDELYYARRMSVQTLTGAWGLMRKNMRMVTLPQVTWIQPTLNGFAAAAQGGKVEKKEIYTMETLGDVPGNRYERGKRLYWQVEGAKWGVIDTLGRWMLQPQFDYLSSFTDSVAIYGRNKCYGLVHVTGKELTPALYGNIQFLNSNWNSLLSMTLATGKAGLLDTLGRWIVAPDHDRVLAMRNGWAPVCTGKVWKLVDATGKAMDLPALSDAHPFQEGFARVRDAKGYFFVNAQGEPLGDQRFVKAEDFQDGMAHVVQKGMHSYLTAEGKVVGSYREAANYRAGRAVVKLEKGFTVIDKAQKVVFRKRFKELSWINDTLLMARDDKFTGVVNLQGKWCFKGHFASLRDAGNGWVIAQQRNGFAYLDLQGKEAMGTTWQIATPFVNGLAKVKAASGWGYMDATGNMVVPANHLEVQDYHEGVAFCKSRQDDWLAYREDGSRMALPGGHLVPHPFQQGVAVVTTSITVGGSRVACGYSGNCTYTYLLLDSLGDTLGTRQAQGLVHLGAGVCWVLDVGGWNLIGADGHLLTDLTLAEAPLYADGQAAVIPKPKSALYTLQGKELVPAAYDRYQMDGNLVRAYSGGSWDYYDLQGKPVWTRDGGPHAANE